MNLLQPIKSHIQNNNSTFGARLRQLRIAVSLVVAFEDDDHSLWNEFDLS